MVIGDVCKVINEKNKEHYGRICRVKSFVTEEKAVMVRFAGDKKDSKILKHEIEFFAKDTRKKEEGH